MSAVQEYIGDGLSRFTDEIIEFLRIPSISAKSDRDADTRRAAGENAPTILVYGHYDVQPAEPLDLWDSPPFEPELREGRLYARGSADDKGQLYLHVKAAEAHLKAGDGLPVNLIILAEGEEEVGSPNLLPFVEANGDRLACDAIVISDSAMFAPGLPCLLFSLRGLAYCEIHVDGPSSDLHSGSYGGPVVNPAMALSQILSGYTGEGAKTVLPARGEAYPSSATSSAFWARPRCSSAFRYLGRMSMRRTSGSPRRTSRRGSEHSPICTRSSASRQS